MNQPVYPGALIDASIGEQPQLAPEEFGPFALAKSR
jgi:hypothetical protein